MKEDSKIKEKIEIIDEVIEDEGKEKSFLEDLQRVQADFENYIKRVEKEKNMVKEIAKAELLLKLISIKEDFDKAVDNDDDNEGVKMIHNNFKKLLEEEGVKEIKSLGEEFNHNFHDVVKKNGEGKITGEIQKGYMLNDKILRVAKVIIGGKENE